MTSCPGCPPNHIQTAKGSCCQDKCSATAAVDPDCAARLNLLYGNPYFSPMRPIPEARPICNPCSSGQPHVQNLLYNEIGRSGYIRGLVQYPEFVDAKSGMIIVTERDNHRLQFFDNAGQECRFNPFGCRGCKENQFDTPGGVTTTNEHYVAVVVADTGNRRVCLYSICTDHRGYGTLSQTFEFGNNIFQEPMGLDYDVVRNKLVVADSTTKRVSIHDLRTGVCCGEMKAPRDCPFVSPTDVAIDQRNGTCYVTDCRANIVHVYERNGDFIGKFGGTGCAADQFNKPWGICLDREYNLIISDEMNDRVVMHAAPDRSQLSTPFCRVVALDVYRPKGVSINVHENLVMCDQSAHNFIKILKYK